MSKENCRSIGAIIGLAVGIGAMNLLGFGGMVNAALYGAGGAVAGGIAGERFHAMKHRG